MFWRKDKPQGASYILRCGQWKKRSLGKVSTNRFFHEDTLSPPTQQHLHNSQKCSAGCVGSVGVLHDYLSNLWTVNRFLIQVLIFRYLGQIKKIWLLFRATNETHCYFNVKLGMEYVIWNEKHRSRRCESINCGWIACWESVDVIRRQSQAFPASLLIAANCCLYQLYNYV